MDHYSTLGVPRTATQEEIKKAYRKLAMQHHPDRTGGDDTKFKEIQTAYDAISDPQKRQQYDNPQPQYQGFPGGFPGGFGFNVNGFDMNDLFAQAFGQQRNPFQQNKNTFRTVLSITLEDAYNMPDKVVQLGTPSGTKVVTIKIPRGVDNGLQVRYDNILDDAYLVIEFNILKDLRFDREQSNLYSNMKISVLDLIVGTKLEFTTISGNTLEVTVPPMTQPNQQIRLTGCGMPVKNGSYGDQILLLKPFIPASIDQSIIDAIKSQSKY